MGVFRTWATLGTLALCLLAVPFAAEAAPGDELVVEDPGGDHTLRLPSGNTTPPSGYEDADLLRAWVGNESVAGFDIGLQVAHWDQPGLGDGFRPSAAYFEIRFKVEKQQYRVSIQSGTCRATEQATLEAWNPGTDDHRHVSCANVTIDRPKATAQVHLEKDFLLDDRGLGARRGTDIADLFVTSTVRVDPFSESFLSIVSAEDTSPEVIDRVPDEGAAPPFLLAVGDDTSTHIQLSSPTPIRFSNGESTTMVFEVLVENLGDRSQTVFLELHDLEPSWTGRVPARVLVDAAGSAIVPVILTTEFTHRHGETSLFHVVARSSGENAESRLPLGIRWADSPQPAGHHNVLYLHSKPADPVSPVSPVFNVVVGSRVLWANTLQDDPDPNATDGPTYSNWYAQRQGPVGPEYYQGWSFVLDPALLIGLDLAATQEGVAELTFQSGLGDVTSKVTVQLLYCDPTDTSGLYPATANCERGSWFPLVNGDTGPFSPGQQQTRTLPIPLKTEPGRDLIPYVEGSNLRVHIEYLHTQAAFGSDQASPALDVSKSTITLPLEEYHDPLDQAFAAVGSLRLDPLSPFAKIANPGRSSVYAFRVANEAQNEQDLRLSVEGHNAQWASLGETDFTVAPGGKREFAVTVEVPFDASEGERAELFVVAENVDDPATVAIARLRTSVIEGSDIPDEAQFAAPDEANGTPGPSAVVFGSMVAAVCALIRRRKSD